MLEFIVNQGEREASVRSSAQMGTLKGTFPQELLPNAIPKHLRQALVHRS